MARPSWFPASTAWGPAAPEGPGLYSHRSPLHLCQVEGEPPVPCFEGLQFRRLGVEMDHFVPAGLEGLAALRMFAGEDAGLLVTEGEVPAADFRSLGKGMGSPVLGSY